MTDPTNCTNCWSDRLYQSVGCKWFCSVCGNEVPSVSEPTTPPPTGSDAEIAYPGEF